MVEVEQKDKENSDNVVRRFINQLRLSGVLPAARKTRFHIKKKTKRKQKEEALYRMKVKKEVDKMKKMGVFDDEKLKDIKRKISENKY